MTIISFIGNIISNLSERGKSPVMGSFFTSWLLFNWQVVLILLFSDLDTINKIHTIEKDYANPCYNFLYPLLFTIFYLFAHPFIYRFSSELKYRMVSLATGKKLNAEIEFMQKRIELTKLEERNKYEKDINEIKRFNEKRNYENDQKQQIDRNSIEIEYYRKTKELELKKKEAELEMDLYVRRRNLENLE